jgi:hypothetical protein
MRSLESRGGEQPAPKAEARAVALAEELKVTDVTKATDERLVRS